MFINIKKLCDDYEIDYMVGDRTLLGAVRYRGIPWDDDNDIMMTRKNYELLESFFDKELGKNIYWISH